MREVQALPVEKLERFVRTILNGFESYFAEFQNVTLAAKSRFENADWLGIRAASIQRIDLYKANTAKVIEYVQVIAGDELRELDFWREARDRYSELIEGHNNFEIAETFFNSVYCAVFKHRKIRNEYAFVFSPLGDMPPSDVSKVYRTYRLDGQLDELLERMLADYAFSVPYEDMQRDIVCIREAINN
ncbi:MAG: isocitrate dehydrogenase kinase/phosphatase AceK regulatory subunit [Halioglobus sp.]|nr:isocitrate dehydrogenase kinase/phosphatase AceK regulatory subunit [Halioglobus sp.]